jgi:protein CpxP
MKKPSNSLLLFLVIFLVVTNIGILLYFTGFGRPGHAPRGDHKSFVTGFVQNDLKFSKEQMAALDSLKKTHRSGIRPLFEALGTAKDDFYSLLSNPAVPDSVLQAAADDIGKKQAALDIRFFRNFQEIRQLCTPAQLPAFDSGMPAVAGRMMQPWKKNGGHGQDSLSYRK